MNIYEQYFQSKCIPYKKNVELFNHQQQLVNTIKYLIPGAVINIKAGQYHINHKYDIEDLIHQINKQLELIPVNYHIYLFFEKRFDDPLLFQEFKINQRVMIVFDLQDIVMQPYPYYIQDTVVLRTMASESATNCSWLTILKNHIFYVTQNTYLKSICIMNESESQRFKQYQIEIVDNRPDNCIIVNNKDIVYLKSTRHYTIDYTFTIFQYLIKPYRLKSGTPKIIIENISYICPTCDKLLFVGKLCLDCNPKK